MLVDNGRTQPKAHAGSLEILCCKESFENPFDVLSRDTHSIICNCDPECGFREIDTQPAR